MPPKVKKLKREPKKCEKSIVWQFFDKPTDPNASSVTCPKCCKEISFSGGTTALRYHFENIHPEDFARITKMPISSDGEMSPKELLVAIEKSLARALAVGLVPFRFCENFEFKRFVELLQEYKEIFRVPSASKMRRLIQTLSDEHVMSVEKKLENIKKFTIITDGCSDFRRNFHFYSLHVSFVEESFHRKTLFCGIRGTEGNDAVSIGETLCGLLEQFGLQFSECSALAVDGASSLRLLADTHSLDRIHCSCHILNLVIGDFAKNREVQNIQKRVENFAAHLARNKSSKANLKAMSLLKGVKSSLPLPLPATRWAGLYLLLDQYLTHYDSAKDLAELQKFLVKSAEIEKVKEIRDVLKPVYEAVSAEIEDENVESDDEENSDDESFSDSDDFTINARYPTE